MKIILTHDGADFDAVASLLAMHRLDPDATPILPKRLNRNVAQFLVIYAAALPALHREDFNPRGEIELAYVVDTQSFSMVRGMEKETPLHIIDHHPVEKTFPDYVHFEGEQLGANTTLLIEHLVERGITLTSPEATLLLLGIYEDTGKLTYRGTTARDMRAAAWLLEQGADLDVVRSALHYTLNDEQRSLLAKLEESAEMLTIHGYKIVLAAGLLEEPLEELAALAHPLRDLFDCDALIMLLQVQNYVQMIARSLVDNIDVGAIARHLGGGGHERAAAALIRETTLTPAHDRLVDILYQEIRPAVRVAELMSWGVQSIQVSATIGEAHAAMLQTGHEGYPVLHGDELVGLLTRQAVDRAMRHHMQNLPVTEIMESVSAAVTPADSIETLKDRMLESGWGQMPVVSEQGQVIGIVTRTDLINSWTQRPPDAHRREEMVTRLQKSLPANLWRLLSAISQVADEQKAGVFLVGGIVRDLLLHRPNFDLDLVVEGDAIALAKTLQAQYGGAVSFHQQFGTAKWKLEPAVADQFGSSDLPETIDLVTSRAEFYEAPTVLPTVRRSSIKLDLHRRDFTINTLAIKLAPAPMGDLLDFYKGEQDLREGLIRVLHSLSFVDDPTRILRAVRFEQRFGFQIEARTLDRLTAALPLMERVSGDRIRHELNLILAEPQAMSILERLEALGVLKAIHPALHFNERVHTHYAELRRVRQSPPWQLPADYDDWRIVAFSLLTYRLSEAELEALCQRLMTARRTVDQLQAVRAGYHLLSLITQLHPSAIVEHLEGLGDTGWLAMWIMADEAGRALLEKFVQQWRHIKPTLDGNTLKAMGVKPGPHIGQILRALRAAWIDGQLKDIQDERAYAQHLIQADHPEP